MARASDVREGFSTKYRLNSSYRKKEVSRKKLNLSKRTLNKLFFYMQICIRKPIYHCLTMPCNIIFPYNAIIRYNYIYRKIEYLFLVDSCDSTHTFTYDIHKLMILKKYDILGKNCFATFQ